MAVLLSTVALVWRVEQNLLSGRVIDGGSSRAEGTSASGVEIAGDLCPLLKKVRAWQKEQNHWFLLMWTLLVWRLEDSVRFSQLYSAGIFPSYPRSSLQLGPSPLFISERIRLLTVDYS